MKISIREIMLNVHIIMSDFMSKAIDSFLILENQFQGNLIMFYGFFIRFHIQKLVYFINL